MMRMMYVEWIDSQGPPDDKWVSRETVELHHGMGCVSIGYLVKDLPDRICLASHLSYDVKPSDYDEASGVIEIPRIAITRMVELRLKRTKKCSVSASSPPSLTPSSPASLAISMTSPQKPKPD